MRNCWQMSNDELIAMEDIVLKTIKEECGKIDVALDTDGYILMLDFIVNDLKDNS